MSNPDAYEAQGAVARRSFKARLSAHLANYIERAIAAGMDGDDLVDAINDAFPSITFHDFAGGFALSRGMSAMEARSFFPRGEGNKPTLTNTCALAVPSARGHAKHRQ